MMNGTITIVADPNIALNASRNNNTKIIVISGNMQEMDPFIQATNASLVSVLLPPPSASMMEIDGNIQGYMESYYSHLNSGNAFMFVCIILRAVYNDMNVILYTTPEEGQLSFMQVLAQFFHRQFGIVMASINNQYLFDYNYFPTILEIMYMNDILTHDELISSYPATKFLANEYVLMRLYNEMVPYIINPTQDEIMNYFNRRIQNKHLIDPLSRGDGM